MANCKHFRKRSKDYITYFYCSVTKKEITFDDCNNCKYKEYKKVKPLVAKTPLKQRSSKQNKLERNRYSIFTNDFDKCIECGKIYKKEEINLHEIFYGNGKRQLSIKYGLVIPLYWKEYHNQIEQKGIHFDKDLCNKWKKLGQLKFMEYYNKNEEEFIKIFGRSYL